jgi:hypothetical protein
MKLTDIFEQIGAPVGASSIATPPAGGPAVTNPATSTNAMAAAAIAQQRKQREEEKKAVQAQIQNTKEQLAQLQQQLLNLNKPV